MAGPKADKLTKERRVEAVYRLLLDGYTPAQIMHDTAAWNLKERQRRQYIAEARQRISDGMSPLTRAELLAEHLAGRRQLRREAKTVKDKLAVLKDEAELLGLYPPRQHELRGKDGGALETVIRFEWSDNDGANHPDSTAA